MVSNPNPNLNRPKPKNKAPTSEDMDINTELRSIQEIKAIREMKNDKAPGSWSSRHHHWTTKHSRISNAHHPAEDFPRKLISKNMPEDSKTALMVKLVKKGDLSNCNNWRGITLLSPTSKEEWRRTCKGNSCSDHILMLRQILEQLWKWTAHNKETKKEC